MFLIHKIHRYLLPSVTVKDRLQLPRRPGCYYVFRGFDMIYVGAAEAGIRQRWSGHHIRDRLRPDDRIHYWVMPKILVPDRESQDIDTFRPRLNGRREPRDWRGRLVGWGVNLGCWTIGATVAWCAWITIFVRG